MADAYGLDDFSLLSGPQQDTARMIQKSFNASQGGLNRSLARYNLTDATSGPLHAEMMNDTALKRAQVTAGILNQNQQLQNVIDASHRTPHGFMENLAAYAPALGGLSRLYPMLFGTDNSFSKQGLIPSAYQGAKNVVHWFTGSDGSKIGLDASGNVVPFAPGFNWTSGYDLPSGGAATTNFAQPNYSQMPTEPDWSGWNSTDFGGTPADLSNWFG